MNKILDIVEDIKQNITDNQYKTIMESLMEINNINKLSLLTNNYKLNKIICLFNWLDTKLKLLILFVIRLKEVNYINSLLQNSPTIFIIKMIFIIKIKILLNKL